MEISSSSGKVIARWAKLRDRILITELLRHVRNGERILNKFGQIMWSQVTAQVNEPSIGTDIPMLNVCFRSKTSTLLGVSFLLFLVDGGVR